MYDESEIKAKLKQIHALSQTDEITLPLDIFKDRRLGMLEAAVVYLKDHYSQYDQIIFTKKYGEPHEYILFFWPPNL